VKNKQKNKRGLYYSLSIFFKKDVLCLFKKYISLHLPRHIHLSWRWSSGAVMLGMGLSLGVFLLDPALFSANLVQQRIFNEEEGGFLENSRNFSGVLTDSPLYSLRDYFHSSVNEDDLLILFAKTSKASQVDLKLAEEIYKEFLEKLHMLDYRGQVNVLYKLAENLQYSDISDPFFPQLLDVFSRIEKQDYWVNQLLLLSYSGDSRNLFESRTEMVFESLAQKKNWRNFVTEKGIVGALRSIKNTLESPITKDGEVFHAAAEEWMLKNEVWRNL
jgi:hypothetical protein